MNEFEGHKSHLVGGVAILFANSFPPCSFEMEEAVIAKDFVSIYLHMLQLYQQKDWGFHIAHSLWNVGQM